MDFVATSMAQPVTRTDVEVQLAASRPLREAFVDLPWRIYQNDPHWVPPLKNEVRRMLDPQHHAFYQHGTAACFVARVQGEIVGRIMASYDPYLPTVEGARVGCFGLFECLDDQTVADALFARADQWFAEHGIGIARGPIDFSMNYACGLLVDGFDTPPRVMMNHHPPYYRRLIEQAGFEQAKDAYAWWFDDPHDMIAHWSERAQRLAQRYRIRIRPINVANLDEDIERMKLLYHQAWDEAWGFAKMSDAEFHASAQEMKRFAVPEMILMAEVDDEPVGLSITLPDLNEAIRPLNGRLFRWGLPIGLAQLYRNMKRIRTARLAVLGVTPGYRRRGVAELLILRTLDYGKHVLNYTGAELSWTLADNELVNRTIQRVGGSRYKTYRFYERPVR